MDSTAKDLLEMARKLDAESPIIREIDAWVVDIRDLMLKQYRNINKLLDNIDKDFKDGRYGDAQIKVTCLRETLAWISDLQMLIRKEK